MQTVFFHQHELKHVASIAKVNSKDASNNLRNVYLILRNARVYLCALDGHSMAIYSRDGLTSQQNETYAISFEDAEKLMSIKSKIPHISFTIYESEPAKIEFSGFTCKAQKIENGNFIENIFARIEGIAKRGKLIPTPAMHAVGAKQLQYIFPDKTAKMEMVQPAGNTRDFQLCTDSNHPDFLAVLMPFASSKESKGKAIKQARAFFTA